MLPKAYRLRKDNDFRRAYKKGNIVVTPFFRVHFFFHNTGMTRMGIVISNKTIKKATERNRKKRQLRAILRDLAPIMKSGYDVVVTYLAQAVVAPADAIKSDVVGFLTKIQLIDDKRYKENQQKS